MSRKANYYKIGVFVIIGMVIAVVGVIVFGAGKLLREKYTVETYFNQSVQGLNIGAPLKFQGVKIGSVSEIFFVFNNYTTDYQYVLVRADVFLDLTSRGKISRITSEEEKKMNLNEMIKKGLRLELSSQGVTGIAFLNAVYLDPERYPPLKIDWKPDFQYIPSAPGTITMVTQSIEKLTKSLDKIDIKNIIDNLDTLIKSLSTTVKDTQIGKITTDMRQVLYNLNKGIESLNSFLESKEMRTGLNDFSETMENIKMATKDLPETLKHFKTTTRNLPDTIAHINKTARRLDKLIAIESQDIETIIDNIRIVSENLKEFTDNSKRYPSHILFGEPPRRLKEVK